jgi:two-component system response regulator YesN
MPEENGLSLFRWTMEKHPEVVGVFLTSHAEFEYAREAIRLGGFDYILQPARMEERLKRFLIPVIPSPS